MKEKEYLLWLSRIDSLGLKKQYLLFDYFNTAEEIFFAKRNILENVVGLTDVNISNILKVSSEDVIGEYLREMEKKNINFVTSAEDEYPFLLRQVYDAPLVLYYKGSLISNEENCVSVIGSRKCTEYGKTVAFKASKDLAKENIVIVSGMARGIDSMAHRGAIEGGGLTVAVLGSGVDICYPSENKNLMDRIIENGCVISEQPPGTRPMPGFFPMRNRIISGLSKTLLVVEAAEKSGTLITVDDALEQGRNVFAVPGNITSKWSSGTNRLLKDGAMFFNNYLDIIEDLGIKKSSEDLEKEKENENKFKDLLPDEIMIYNFISEEPVLVDEILSKSKCKIQVLNYILAMLEMKGYIQKMPGQKYIKSL